LKPSNTEIGFKISRADVANYMIKAVENRSSIGKVAVWQLVQHDPAEELRGYREAKMGTGGILCMFTSRPIGFVSSPYKNPSEVPKGLGAKHDADGVLKILPEFEAGLADIEGFSHLIVIWEFDRSQGFELTASPPSDNRTHGVFATRSPLRPNPIALTTIELLRRDGANLHVRGVDMLDGTPILDIKPYLSNIPSEKLRRGWLAEAEARQQT
jgi:tRNA (adenine37-N6)-methyltransferase